MSLADALATASLTASVITAIAATYLSLLALRFTARPRFIVELVDPQPLRAGTDCVFRFRVRNTGYWFGTPAATGITVFANFDPKFHLVRARYGAALEIENTEVRTGKNGLVFVKARQIKLFSRSASEDFVVEARTPDVTGVYVIDIDAVSVEGGSAHALVKITVTR